MNLFSKRDSNNLLRFFREICQPDDDDIPLRNAVARIALSAIQKQLPQFGIVSADGRVSLGRMVFEKAHADVGLLPRFLFTINWADSGPGASWPEAYHLAYIPLFDRYVVTASTDSPGMWGVTELALGSFPSTTELHAGCRQLISAWWRYQTWNDQGRWAYVWREGEILVEEAERWADAVWPADPEYFEETEELMEAEIVLLDEPAFRARILQILQSSTGGGLYSQTVTLPDGEKRTYSFSWATGMNLTFSEQAYRRHFGLNIPDWLNLRHPSHRATLCKLAMTQGRALPEQAPDQHA